MIMKRPLIRAFIVAACLAACGPAVAEGTFRCGARLIEVGMTQSEVQHWTYASYSAARVLVFDEDTLKSIE
jgi:hypothetical protein